VDGQSLAAFEEDLKGNLYKIWNRMSSGSYIPPPVRLVEIPKGDGKLRPLQRRVSTSRVITTRSPVRSKARSALRLPRASIQGPLGPGAAPPRGSARRSRFLGVMSPGICWV